MQRSITLLVAGKVDEAHNNLTEVLNFDPNSAEAHYLLARVHGARGNTKSRSAELAEAVRLNPELLGARLEYARALTSSGAAITAQQVLDDAPERQKRNAAFIAERNWVLAALNRKSEMRKSLDEAITTMRSPDLMLQDALLKFDAGKSTEASSALEEALRHYPEEIRALDLLAQFYATRGNQGFASTQQRTRGRRERSTCSESGCTGPGRRRRREAHSWQPKRPTRSSGRLMSRLPLWKWPVRIQMARGRCSGHCSTIRRRD
jgi:Tfp pilus assembly protein PilF